MDIETFYGAMSKEFSYIDSEVGVSDALFKDLYEAFLGGGYELEEFLALVDEFFAKLRRLDLDEDEKWKVLHSYLDTYDSIEYDDEAFDELYDDLDQYDDIDTDDVDDIIDRYNDQPDDTFIEEHKMPYEDFKKELTDYSSAQQDTWIQHLSEDEDLIKWLYNNIGVDDLVNGEQYVKKYLRPIGEFMKDVLEDAGAEEGDYTKEELFNLISDYVQEWDGEGMPLVNGEAMNKYMEENEEMLDELLDVTVDGEEDEVEVPEQVEPPTAQDPLGDGINSGLGTLDGSVRSYTLDFLASMSGDEVIYDQIAFHRLYYDLYNELSDAGLLTTRSGAVQYGTSGRNGTMWSTGVILDDSIAQIFLYSYVYSLYDTYLKGLSDSELTEYASSLGLSDENEPMVGTIKRAFDNGQEDSVLAMLTNDEYAKKFTNIFNSMEVHGDNMGAYNFMENVSDLQNLFWATNKDYTYNDIFNYIEQNETAFTNEEFTDQSVIDYYTDKEYVYDEETGTVSQESEADQALGDAVDGLKDGEPEEGQDPSQTADDLANMVKDGEDKEIDPDDPTGTGENSRQLTSSNSLQDYVQKNYGDLYNSTSISDEQWNSIDYTSLGYDSMESYWTAVKAEADTWLSSIATQLLRQLSMIDDAYQAYILNAYFNSLVASGGQLLQENRDNEIYRQAYDDTVDELQQIGSYNLNDPPKDEKYTSLVPSTASIQDYVNESYGDMWNPSSVSDEEWGYINLDYLGYDDMDSYFSDVQDEADQWLRTCISDIGWNFDDVDDAYKSYIIGQFFEALVANNGILDTTENLQTNLDNSWVDRYLAMRDDLNTVEDMREPPTDKKYTSGEPVDVSRQLQADDDGELYAVLNPDGTYTIAQVDDNNDVTILDPSLTKDEYADLNEDVDMKQMTADEWDQWTQDQYDEAHGQVEAPDSTQTIPEDMFESQASVDKYVSYGTAPYYVDNGDGTYDIYEKSSDGTYVKKWDNYSGDVSQIRETTMDDMLAAGDYTDTTANTKAVPEKGSPAEKATNLRGRIMNDNINILQQTDNYGPVELRTKKQLGDPLYQEMYDEAMMPSSEPVYYSENGTDVYRLDGLYQQRITNEEWEIVKESFNYDRDVTKPFEIKDGKYEDKPVSAEYAIEHVNEWEYFFELGQSRDFYTWLDSRSEGTESRSFVSYMINRQVEASEIDIANYKKGSVLDLLPSLDYRPHTRAYNTRATQKAILDTHELGINNVSAFVLSSSVCSLFTTMIMENIKRIADNPVISKFEVGEDGDVSGLDDAVISGMYEKGSKIRQAIEQATALNPQQKNILSIIFKNRSFKTLSEYEISNRYGEIIFNFFGKTDDRKHQMENNTGIVVFNIGLILLGYYASYIDTNSSIGIDTDVTSNLIKVISHALEILYPAQKYDSELIRQLDALVSEFVREIKAVHRGQTASDNLKEILYEPVANMVHRAFSETGTRFMIDQFFNKETLDHITSNFGLQMHMQVGSVDSLIEFILNGFVDAEEFNQIVTKMMKTTLGENFGFSGNNMFDVLFMSKVQANTFLLNPRFNILIPLIHPETIGLIPEKKVDVTMWGFGAKIVGLVEYEKDVSVYTQSVQEDVRRDASHPDEEPVFLEREEAEERAEHIGAEGVHETDGGFRAGADRDELDSIYEGRHEPENRIMSNVTENLENDKPGVEREHRVMEDKEDYEEVGDSFAIEEAKDWSLAGLLDFANSNYATDVKDYEKQFREMVTNWKDDELKFDFEESGDRDYVVVKNEDRNEMYVMFKGSQTFTDWLSNIYTGFNKPTLRGYKDREAIEADRDHAGFTGTYSGYRDKLLDIVDKRTNRSTKIMVTGHSRGTALSNLFLEDLVDHVNVENIMYRGFGAVNFRREGSAKKFNNKIRGVDMKNYYIEGDPIRWVNNFTPYYPTGENLLITSESRDQEAGPFKTMVLDKLKSIESEGKGMGDLDKILRTEFAENHGTDMYKILLAQDSHEMAYKRKKDSYWGDSLLNKIVGSSMAVLAAHKAGSMRSMSKLLSKLL